jgi:hypothetical protein
LVLFKIMINVQNEMQNLAKFAHFEKFIFIQEWLTQKCDMLRQLYVFLITSCKKIHSNSFSYMKDWQGLKKYSQSFCKIIP